MSPRKRLPLDCLGRISGNKVQHGMDLHFPEIPNGNAQDFIRRELEEDQASLLGWRNLA